MRVVVTGGAGFIGANLCRRLLSSGVASSVVAVDDLSTGSVDNLAGTGATFVDVDIRHPDLGDAFDGADAVVHLAARPSVPRSLADPYASHDVNTTGTVRVLEAIRARSIRHVVLASSSSVYGSNPVLPKHEGLLPAPISPYAASKLAAEAATFAWARSFGIGALVFRFFNVFGPLQAPGHAYAAVVPAFVSAALNGEPIPLHGDGSQTRDFTYVGTVVDVLADAVSRRVTADGPVNLAFGTRISLLELIAELAGILGHPLAVSERPNRAGDVPHSQADTTVLLSHFSSVEPVTFPEALRATVEWMRSTN